MLYPRQIPKSLKISSTIFFSSLLPFSIKFCIYFNLFAGVKSSPNWFRVGVELKLPFTAVLCDEDIDAEFLRKYGFKEKESDYS